MVHAGPAVAKLAKPTAAKEVSMKRILYFSITEFSTHTEVIDSVKRDANRLLAKE